VGQEVEKGEENGERLLHAQEAVEGPFTMKLYDWLRGSYALVGDNVLASIVAFGSAIPEEKLV
jgi:hypothetical protein